MSQEALIFWAFLLWCHSGDPRCIVYVRGLHKILYSSAPPWISQPGPFFPHFVAWDVFKRQAIRCHMKRFRLSLSVRLAHKYYLNMLVSFINSESTVTAELLKGFRALLGLFFFSLIIYHPKAFRSPGPYASVLSTPAFPVDLSHSRALCCSSFWPGANVLYISTRAHKLSSEIACPGAHSTFAALEHDFICTVLTGH